MKNTQPLVTYLDLTGRLLEDTEELPPNYICRNGWNETYLVSTDERGEMHVTLLEATADLMLNPPTTVETFPVVQYPLPDVSMCVCEEEEEYPPMLPAALMVGLVVMALWMLGMVPFVAVVLVGIVGAFQCDEL